MKPSHRTMAFSLLSVMLGAVLGLVGPRNAAAEKLPVDCSGGRADCYIYRVCSEWVNHRCMEIDTRYWYWYK